MQLTIIESILYLFLASFLILIFATIITIFGLIFYNFIEKTTKRKWNLNFFEKVLLSFGIGVSIYISICYIIAIFRFMNFFTIYLPIILIDIFYLIYLIYHEPKLINSFFYSIKIKILRINKNQLIYISILIPFLYITFLFYWKIIIHSNSLIGIDPIDITGKVSKTLDYGFIPHDYAIIYPQGFRILCVSCLSLLISPDLKTVFYFFKFAPLLYILFYMLVLASVLKNIFKKNCIVLFGLLGILSTNYFHFRSLRFISSNIATLLLLISLIILISDCPKYILGFFISSIYLINPVVALYYILSLTIYFSVKLLSLKKGKGFHHFFIEIIKTIILTIGLILPFVLYLFFIGFSIFDLMKTYNYFFGISLQLTDGKILLNINQISLSEEQLDFLTNWTSEEDQPWLKKRYRDNTIIFSYYFIFAILGLLLKDKKNNDISLFGKCIIIIILFTFFVPVFLTHDSLITPIPFWMKLRMLECFCAPIIIMECFVINLFFEKAKILTFYLFNKMDFFKKFSNEKRNLTFLKIENIIIILVLSSGYSNYYIIRQEYEDPWGVYAFNEEQIEAIFYIRENLPKDTEILVSEYVDEPSRNAIYKLLYDYECHLWDFSIDHCYNKTKKYCYENDIKYILIDFSKINHYQLKFFYMNEINFREIFKNNRFVILKTENNLGEIQDFGIYISTWNFMDDNEGDQGYEISFINNYYSNSYLCSASIKKTVGNHGNVLDMVTNKFKGLLAVTNYLGWNRDTIFNPTSGTIEFWWQTTDVNQCSQFTIFGDFNNIFLDIKINETQFQYYDGLSWSPIKSNILNNEWYHVRIDFECSNESYLGLKQNSFDLYIDDILELDDINFINIINDAIRIKLSSYQDSSSFHTYFDAFGYSWDSEYNIGDNWKKIYL